MYDPTVGRFLEEDPIGIAGGDLNFYRYCGNGPDETRTESERDVLEPAYLAGCGD